jgi:4-alpha-glucanotransferase
VAGCPPDAYAEDGQLWGNPIYDWDKMKTEGFAWWLDRIGKSFTLYDVLRMDHFRGFAGYYTIPFGEETAKNGQWNRGPGMDLFRAVKETFPAANIIAEDLGFITDDVRDLLRDTAFPGMKVLQFAFYDDNSEYLPRTYATDNCIVYASTHDSDCTRSWYENLDDAARARFKRECPRHKGQSATLATVELALSSRADLAVIALQDYLELTNEQGRINVPSRAEGNWSWRVSPRYATAKRKDMIKTLAVSTGRAK